MSDFPSNIHDDYDEKPTFEVGDTKIIGEPNRYDLIAQKRGIDFAYRPLVPIPSYLRRAYITSIERAWRPKENAGICSWLSHGDYSNNPRFEEYWRVETDCEKLYYELADFLEG